MSEIISCLAGFAFTLLAVLLLPVLVVLCCVIVGMILLGIFQVITAIILWGLDWKSNE